MSKQYRPRSKEQSDQDVPIFPIFMIYAVTHQHHLEFVRRLCPHHHCHHQALGHLADPYLQGLFGPLCLLHDMDQSGHHRNCPNGKLYIH